MGTDPETGEEDFRMIHLPKLVFTGDTTERCYGRNRPDRANERYHLDMATKVDKEAKKIQIQFPPRGRFDELVEEFRSYEVEFNLKNLGATIVDPEEKEIFNRARNYFGENRTSPYGGLLHCLPYFPQNRNCSWSVVGPPKESEAVQKLRHLSMEEQDKAGLSPLSSISLILLENKSLNTNKRMESDENECCMWLMIEMCDPKAKVVGVHTRRLFRIPNVDLLFKSKSAVQVCERVTDPKGEVKKYDLSLETKVDKVAKKIEISFRQRALKPPSANLKKLLAAIQQNQTLKSAALMIGEDVFDAASVL